MGAYSGRGGVGLIVWGYYGTSGAKKFLVIRLYSTTKASIVRLETTPRPFTVRLGNTRRPSFDRLKPNMDRPLTDWELHVNHPLFDQKDRKGDE